MRANDLKVAAILLAAGLSRRMGEPNKLLIEIGGEPLVRRTARVYLSAGADVLAVLGHEAEQVRAALADMPVSFAVNPHYEEGQQSSVRAGIESLTGGFDAILVALADQAALMPADISDLIDAFARSGANRIIVPYFCGNRGNPVVFPARLIAEMRAAGRNAACRSFIDNNPQLTERYEADHDRFIIDIDTPDDLASFRGRPLPGRMTQKKLEDNAP
ncbi:MAG: NTP transferase domain-containing protein [Rhodomicrobium sp.]